jgi:hypothetical protein
LIGVNLKRLLSQRVSLIIPERKYFISDRIFFAQKKNMRLIEFVERFPDEASCRRHFKLVREAEGVICKKCNGTKHYWLSGKEQFECKNCRFRTTLRSGTVMESSNLPFRQWYICMHIMSSIKKGVSAKEMQRQLGRRRYQPVWEMMHKLRLSMGHREDHYDVSGFIEMHEYLFKDSKDSSSKESRRNSASKVLVASESGPLKVRMIERIDRTDKARKVGSNERRYNKLSPFSENHQRFPGLKPASKRVNPWIFKVISNAKKIIIGIHHYIHDSFFQNYLDEFCYKFNRRFDQKKLFERLVVAAVKIHWQS